MKVNGRMNNIMSTPQQNLHSKDLEVSAFTIKIKYNFKYSTSQSGLSHTQA